MRKVKVFRRVRLWKRIVTSILHVQICEQREKERGGGQKRGNLPHNRRIRNG